LTPMHRSGAILLSPTLIDPDMQDPASELRRIPLLGTSVNKLSGWPHVKVHREFIDLRYNVFWICYEEA
jgi:hypothetical protein